MDIKEFKKQVKTNCNFMASPALRKECTKKMMCYWDHCQKEQQDLASTPFTDADRESCKNKDFIKEFACRTKLMEKKGIMDKHAALNHCTANKCPQAKNLFRKNFLELAKEMKELNKKNPIIVQREKCMNEHCPKEVQEMKKQSKLTLNTIYECQKKFATHKELIKCNRKQNIQTTKANLKAGECRKKHCDIQPSNSNKKNTTKNATKNATKSNKKKNNNKKTKKN